MPTQAPVVHLDGRATHGRWPPARRGMAAIARAAGQAHGRSSDRAVLAGPDPGDRRHRDAHGRRTCRSSSRPTSSSSSRRVPLASDAVSASTPLGAALQLTVAGLFFAAAILYRALERAAPDRPIAGYLSIGLVIAGFGQVHAALHPGRLHHPRHDRRRAAPRVLRGAARRCRPGGPTRPSGAAGGQCGARADAGVGHGPRNPGGARQARPRDPRRARAGPVVREAQAGAHRPGAGARGRDPDHRERGPDAIDTALADARQAVSALREGTAPGAGLEAVVRDAFEDFTDRFGLRGTFEADDGLPSISPRGQAE